jgi:sodium/bile acid cotransporter 7
MIEFLRQRSFLLALIAVLWAGIGWPEAMRPIADWLPSDYIVAGVTFIMALPLETQSLLGAVRRPGPAWLGAAINSALAPPLGWLFSLVLPTELAIGVVLAASVPCTLATAAVWTRRAGGNDAIAFLVTMITNLGCFIVVPMWLVALVGVHAEIDVRRIVTSLLLLVVLPIVVAQVLRRWAWIGQAATARKQLLSRIAQFGVLLMVFGGAVKCGFELKSVENSSLLSLTNVGTMVAVVAAVHSILLVVGWRLSRKLKIARGDSIAVAFAGSQKTLVIGTYLAQAVGPLAILPMVAYHAAQLIIDTLVADWLREE